MALAVAAGVALFIIGAHAIDSSSDDKKADEEKSHINITLKIDDGLIVKYNGRTIESGVPFEASDDVTLKITIPAVGEYNLTYNDPGTGGSGDDSGYVPAGITFDAYIAVFIPWSEDITGAVTFTRG